jgi:acyl-CoA thioester hydrolase
MQRAERWVALRSTHPTTATLSPEAAISRAYSKGPAVTGRTVAVASATYTTPVRVYYEDTDAAGIVYYANFLKFAERGRTEMLRALGFEHTTLAADTGVIFTVRWLSADYLQPARLDDLLNVNTRVVELGAATLRIEQQIRREEAVLVAINMLVACVGRDGRPRRVPDRLRAVLAPPRPRLTPAPDPPSIVVKTP